MLLSDTVDTIGHNKQNVFFSVSSPLRLPFSWRKNGAEVGFPEYIVGCEEDGRYFCTITEATAEDEGSWECLLDDGSGDGPLCSFCVVKVLIPKHFKVPKFLEDLKVGEEMNPNLIWEYGYHSNKQENSEQG